MSGHDQPAANIERAGWFTVHPLRNEKVHVVTREWFEEVAAENRRLRTLIEQAAAEANHGELTDGTLASMTEVSERG